MDMICDWEGKTTKSTHTEHEGRIFKISFEEVHIGAFRDTFIDSNSLMSIELVVETDIDGVVYPSGYTHLWAKIWKGQFC